MRALSRGFAGSVAGSAMSVVPELDPAVLMSIAWEVYGLRTRMVPKAK
jgi:TctA family transporter